MLAKTRCSHRSSDNKSFGDRDRTHENAGWKNSAFWTIYFLGLVVFYLNYLC
ncbi:hypothetical protein SAMN05192553_101885 [Cyclobacterium xiamenense]|uniref:Uncharacterized protein n=1 Tax=Cyclobacterium xiamenense TaxID=1297121 RepID=A0A1H6USR8_9BACT|nr:hypothetical protein SAMN05192553_101885 [Cyclobacterium xiamenense]